MKRNFVLMFFMSLFLLSCCSLSFAYISPFEKKYNQCIENCSMEAAECKQCCDYYFAPVQEKCQLRFLDCMKKLNDTGICAYRSRNCGAGTTYDCP